MNQESKYSYVPLVTAALTIIFIYGLRMRSLWELRKYKGPPTIWLLGNLHQILFNGLENFLLQTASQFDSICKVYFGGVPILLVSDADIARPVLTKIHRRYQMAGFGSTASDWKKSQQALFWAEGQTWKDYQKIFQPFFAVENIKRCLHFVNRASDKLVARLEKHCDNHQPIEVFNLSELCIMEVVMTSMMGLDTDVFADEPAQAVKILSDASDDFWASMGLDHQGTWVALMYLFPETKPFISKLSDIVRDNMQKRSLGAIMRSEQFDQVELATGPDGKVPRRSVLETFRKQRNFGLKDDASSREGSLSPTRSIDRSCVGSPSISLRGGEAMSSSSFGGSTSSSPRLQRDFGPPSILIDHLRHAAAQDSKLPQNWVAYNALVVYLAGYDTAAITLTYLIYFLSQDEYKHVQEKVMEEVDAYGDGQILTDIDPTKQFPYIHACIKETMRLFPASPTVLRQAEQTITLDKHTVAADQRIIVNVVGMHRSPKYWVKPEQFIPERFIQGSDVPGPLHPWAYVPFGAGTRKCIGFKFAIQELIVFVARTYQQFQFTIEPGQVPIKSKIEMVYHPANGLYVMPVRRRAVSHTGSNRQLKQQQCINLVQSHLNVASRQSVF